MRWKTCSSEKISCLVIDRHEILAARLEEGTLEAEIDATKMDDKSAQRQKLSMIGMSGKGSDAGEEMKSADASQSPDLEGGDDCFQKTAMRPCLIRLSLECFKEQACIWMRSNWPSSALWLRSTETSGGSV